MIQKILSINLSENLSSLVETNELNLTLFLLFIEVFVKCKTYVMSTLNFTKPPYSLSHLFTTYQTYNHLNLTIYLKSITIYI